MTNNTATRDCFLRRIAAEPDEDTHRLAFADWLEEQPVKRVPCLTCGDRCRDSERDVVIDGISWRGCNACSGTGTVLDTDHRDRATFIRLQVELTKWPDADGIEVEVYEAVKEGERELLDTHPEWLRCECPACGGKRVERYTDAAGDTDNRPCSTCWGTGDLLKFREERFRGHVHYTPREVTWDRGFIGGVSCTLAEVGREVVETCTARGSIEYAFSGATAKQYADLHRGCQKCHGTNIVRRFVPSPWAVAVVRAMPVTRFNVTDVRFRLFGTGPGWTAPADFDSMNLVVWEDFADPDRGWPYPTESAARDALALAIGTVVRKAAYPKG